MDALIVAEEDYIAPDVHGRIMLIQDRYHGIYSGGVWLGIMDADAKHTIDTRGGFCLSSGPSGGDQQATEFWNNPPDWIVAGQSPKHVLDLIFEHHRGTQRHG